MEVDDKRHAPSALPLRKRVGVVCTGGYMGGRVRKISSLSHTLRPVASRCTEYAIPIYYIYIYIKILSSSYSSVFPVGKFAYITKSAS